MAKVTLRLEVLVGSLLLAVVLGYEIFVLYGDPSVGWMDTAAPSPSRSPSRKPSWRSHGSIHDTNKQVHFVLAPANFRRFESVEAWRSPDSYESTANPAWRPEAPDPGRYETTGQYLKQPIVADNTELTKNIFLMIKTSASTMWQRLPMHMLTTLTRVDHFGLYSDAPGSVGGYEVVDVLRNMSSGILVRPELKAYRNQVILHDKHGNMAYTDNRLVQSELDRLEAFKNIPMLAHAYSVSPKSDWFVFMESDSYIFMDNLVEILKQYDPNEHLYLGAPTGSGYYQYAGSGSGVVISRRTMMDTLGHNPMLVKEFEVNVFDPSYAVELGQTPSDSLVARMIIDTVDVHLTAHVGFRDAPMHQIGLNADNWCIPAVSFASVEGHTMEVLYEYERIKRLQGTPILHADIYRDFILPHIGEQVEFWDNGADEVKMNSAADTRNGIKAFKDGGPEVRPYETADACQNFCSQLIGCLSWRWRPLTKECGASKSIALGRSSYPWMISARADGGVNATSGWMLDRIQELRTNSVCDEVSAGPKDIEGWFTRNHQNLTMMTDLFIKLAFSDRRPM